MSIILSSIKRSLRDKNVILGNIFLAVLLPYVFTLMYGQNTINENIDMNIVGNKNSEINKSYVKVLEEFDKSNDSISIDYKFYTEEELDEMKLKEETKISNLTVTIDENNKNIKFEGSKTYTIGEEVVAGITEEFFNSISIHESISKEGETPNINSSIVKVSEYENESSKSIIDEDVDYEEYFSIVMIQMAILATSVCSFKNTFYIKENIGNRVKSSPIKIYKLISLELIGSFISSFLQGLVMLAIVSVIYDVSITMQNILGITVLIGILSMLSVSIGLFTTSICSKKSFGENICSLITLIMVLGSGELVPQMNVVIEKIPVLEINPFLAIGKEFNLLVTSNVSENLYTALGVGTFWTIIFMVISMLILNRRVVK